MDFVHNTSQRYEKLGLRVEASNGPCQLKNCVGPGPIHANQIGGSKWPISPRANRVVPCRGL